MSYSKFNLNILIFFITAVLTGIINFSIHILAANKLPSDLFSTFSYYFSIFYIFDLIWSYFTIFLVKNSILINPKKHVLSIIILFACLGLLTSQPIYFILISLSIASVFYLSPYYAGLLIKKDYKKYNLTLFKISLYRILLFSVIIFNFENVYLLLLCIFISYIPIFLPIKYSNNTSKIIVKDLINYLLPTFILLLFINIDGIIVKHKYPDLSALYFVYVNIGKFIIFTSFFIKNIISSEIADIKIDRERYFFKINYTIFFLSFPMFLFLIIFNNFTINLLFGSQYLHESNLVYWYLSGIILFCFSYQNNFLVLSISNKKEYIIYSMLLIIFFICTVLIENISNFVILFFIFNLLIFITSLYKSYTKIKNLS